MTYESDFDTLAAAAATSMARLKIPGVALGVVHGGRIFTAALGVTSVEHPLPVTDATLFQIGSISKTFCATLAYRMAEAGELDLDVPLRTYLPELRLADETVAARVTLRHCFTHTGGWLGDYFDDTGDGDDALARMVAQLDRLPQLTPLGAYWSYNNAGFYLAGRALEVMGGCSYETLVREAIFAPLGMETAGFSAADAITRSFVVGHTAVYGDGAPQVARPWGLARNAAPVGGIIASAAELLRYAQFQLGLVSGPLADESRRAMQRPQVDGAAGEQFGTGWFVRQTPIGQIVRHGGATKGQQATLQLIPERGFGLLVLTNSDRGSELYEPLAKLAFQRFCELDEPPPALVAAAPGWDDAARGDYSGALADRRILWRDGALWLETEPKGGFPTPQTPPGVIPPPSRLAWLGPDQLVGLDAPFAGARIELLRETGEIAWLRVGGRMNRRDTRST